MTRHVPIAALLAAHERHRDATPLYENLGDGALYAGNPVRVVRPVNAKDEELWGWGKQVYIDLAKKYLAEGMEAVG